MPRSFIRNTILVHIRPYWYYVEILSWKINFSSTLVWIPLTQKFNTNSNIILGVDKLLVGEITNKMIY